MNKIKLFFGLAALMVAVAFTSCGETANNIKEKAKDAAAATTDAAAGAAKTVGNAATDVATGAAAAAGAAASATGNAVTGAAAAAGAAAVAAGSTAKDAAGNVVEGAKTVAKDAVDAVKGKGPEYTSAYVCPMHCKGSGSDKAGKCSACGMDYVANAHVGHNH